MTSRLSVLVACCALALGACAPSQPSVDWVQPVFNQSAAFLWSHSGGTLAGSAVLTYDISGNVMIRLMKDLPRPLLEVTSTRTGRFYACGPLAAGGWSGSASSVPLRFSLWQALAEAWRGAVPARDGAQEVQTASYRAAVFKDKGRIRELSVSSCDNGEVIRLSFH